MKLWMTTEYSGDIDSKQRFARNHVRDTINAVIDTKDYELELDSWDCIIILMQGDDSDFTERYQYSAKKKDMDFRLKIDYQAFDEADDIGRYKLIYQMLDRSLDILLEKGLCEKGISTLRDDVKKIAEDNEWI